MEDAIAFTRRWLDIGAVDVEHADHDGSAPPNQTYRYFSMLLDAIPEPKTFSSFSCNSRLGTG